MFSTGQYRVFSGEHSDRILSRPRRLLHEGRAQDADLAYRTVLEQEPDLRAAWLEYFGLLRHHHRFEDALDLSERAMSRFGDDALGPALRGAALVELGRYRDGLAALEEAAARDPNLGMVWHEAGYAAYRLGEYSRALMALDRAFALEPHSGTLHLRGKVLRQAGRYLAAEVSFEGAAEAAEFPEQRAEAERQVRVTRRYAAFPGQRPDNIPLPRRWFAETGAVPLTATSSVAPPTEGQLLDAFAQLTREQGWRFTCLISTDNWEGWRRLSTALDIPLLDGLPSDPSPVPLLVARRPDGTDSRWSAANADLACLGRGVSLALQQVPDVEAADIFGVLVGAGGAACDLPFATEAAQHPEGRLQRRVLS
jgi:tetratricopeptide (TPR) repeat protein